jgi:hypothetical protein
MDSPEGIRVKKQKVLSKMGAPYSEADGLSLTHRKPIINHIFT